jgi:hypothetical protein
MKVRIIWVWRVMSHFHCRPEDNTKQIIGIINKVFKLIPSLLTSPPVAQHNNMLQSKSATNEDIVHLNMHCLLGVGYSSRSYINKLKMFKISHGIIIKTAYVRTTRKFRLVEEARGGGYYLLLRTPP